MFDQHSVQHELHATVAAGYNIKYLYNLFMYVQKQFTIHKVIFITLWFFLHILHTK